MSGRIALFNGTNLENWKPRTGDAHEWQVVGAVSLRDQEPTRFSADAGNGIFYNGPEGNTSDLFTEMEFGDCTLHIEFCVPKNSNSGVYLMGRYEVQILDSWGKDELTFNTCGGIYARWIDGTHHEGNPPRVNASRKPGEWQEYDITFAAPTYDEHGRKERNACFKEVIWNGVTVQEDVEISGPTRAAMFDDDAARGPLMLQGDHGPVAYRNIQITPN